MGKLCFRRRCEFVIDSWGIKSRCLGSVCFALGVFFFVYFGRYFFGFVNILIYRNLRRGWVGLVAGGFRLDGVFFRSVVVIVF